MKTIDLSLVAAKASPRPRWARIAIALSCILVVVVLFRLAFVAAVGWFIGGAMKQTATAAGASQEVHFLVGGPISWAITLFAMPVFWGLLRIVVNPFATLRGNTGVAAVGLAIVSVVILIPPSVRTWLGVTASGEQAHVKEVDGAAVAWFDREGVPLIGFVEGRNGEIKLYNVTRGYRPTDRAKIEPVTAEIRQKWEVQQNDRALNLSRDSRRQEQQEAERKAQQEAVTTARSSLLEADRLLREAKEASARQLEAERQSSKLQLEAAMKAEAERRAQEVARLDRERASKLQEDLNRAAPSVPEPGRQVVVQLGWRDTQPDRPGYVPELEIGRKVMVKLDGAWKPDELKAGDQILAERVSGRPYAILREDRRLPVVIARASTQHTIYSRPLGNQTTADPACFEPNLVGTEMILVHPRTGDRFPHVVRREDRMVTVDWIRDGRSGGRIIGVRGLEGFVVRHVPIARGPRSAFQTPSR